MIDALSRVHALIEARRPHPGRLRLAILGATAALMLGLGVFWLPGALIDHTVSVVPLSKRQQIGRQVLADITRVSGAPCSTPEGDAALGRLRAALMGATADELVVVPAGVATVQALPGRLFIVGHDLVERPDGPDLMAGHILAETLRADRQDPLASLLHWTGIRTSFGLLTTGNLPDGALRGYAEALLTTPKPAVPDGELLIRFAGAGVSSQAYARDIDPGGTTTRALVDDDPQAGATPLLNDDDWVALQGICGA